MKIRSIAIAVAFTVAGIAANANAVQKMGSYDFSYTSVGEPRVRPVQVFDDGQSTYFQFRAGEPIPAIFAVGGGRPVLLVPKFEGPFVRVESVSKKFDLRLGRRTGSVEHLANGGTQSEPTRRISLPATAVPARTGGIYAQVVNPNDVMPAPVNAQLPPEALQLAALGIGINGLPRAVFTDEPTPRIALDLNSYAIPVRGDIAQFQPTGVSPRVTANAASNETILAQNTVVPFVLASSNLGPRGRASIASAAKQYRVGAQVEVVGFYDKSYKEGLAGARVESVKAQLVKNGVPASAITVKSSDAQNNAQLKDAVAGASILVRHSGAPGAATHAYVDTRQQTANNLDAVVSQLRSGRISASAAARHVEAIRETATQSHVQPHSGWQEAQISRWEMRQADGTLQVMLQRWANEAGWQLIWKNGPVVQINGDAVLLRDGFVSASDYVLAQARSFGHKVKGRAYNNKVLVISAE